MVRIRTPEQAASHAKQEHDRYHRRNWSLLGVTPQRAQAFKQLVVALLVQELKERRAGKSRSNTRFVARHPEKMRAHWSNPKYSARILAGARKRLYGLSQGDYAALIDAQDGKCAICKTPLGEKFHTDHCHISGVVRGLLCRGCNMGLGFFKDSASRLLNAIRYLKTK